MLGLSGNAFARLEKNFPQTGLYRPVFCPVLCSEGPSMAVTCSAHAMSHVKVHHGPPPGHWNGRWRRGTTLKIWHPAKISTRGCCGLHVMIYDDADRIAASHGIICVNNRFAVDV